jgi:hypothetical protein
MKMSNQSKTNVDDPDDVINRPLLHAAIKLNTVLFAIVFGIAGGFLLFTITVISLKKGLPFPGHYLNLLGLFLPGYNVSASGAWIGLFWGAGIGAILGALFYRIYARTIEWQVRDYLSGNMADKSFLSAKLRIKGHSLGLAMGVLLGGGLVITTNWLVFGGNPDYSVHASLLSNYLPGYSVSFWGSLVGAAQLFGIAYLCSRLFGWIYDKVLVMRGGDPL